MSDSASSPRYAGPLALSAALSQFALTVIFTNDTRYLSQCRIGFARLPSEITSGES